MSEGGVSSLSVQLTLIAAGITARADRDEVDPEWLRVEIEKCAKLCGKLWVFGVMASELSAAQRARQVDG